jgi:hypothetical protein
MLFACLRVDKLIDEPWKSVFIQLMLLNQDKIAGCFFSDANPDKLTGYQLVRKQLLKYW